PPVSWQFDPCCQYQVSTDSHSLTVQPHAAASLSARSPVVLVRRDDTRRKLLHSAVTLAASLLAVLEVLHHLCQVILTVSVPVVYCTWERLQAKNCLSVVPNRGKSL
ncbi:transmembrane protein 11, mitochondrial-like, partial [Homalodisca vitripennis]|uniref:transmembrane protein 11, mitochondrial-like n=1 Tax=Homalodisca vitripennis TaxID=197043 RepID=UPI001EEA69A9